MFLTCWHIESLVLAFKQTLQNSVETIDTASCKSNPPDSVVATRLPIDISVALDTLVFVEGEAARRRGEPGRDGRLTVITCWTRNGRFLFVLHVVRRSSLPKVSCLSLIDLLH